MTSSLWGWRMAAWWRSAATTDGLRLEDRGRLRATGVLRHRYARTSGWVGATLSHWLEHGAGGTLVWELPDVRAVAVSDTGSTVVWQHEDGLRLTRIEGGRAHTVTPPHHTRWIRPGGRWCLVGDQDGIGLIDLAAAERPRVPMGALTPRCAPAPDHPGLVWTDGPTVYRLRAGGSPQVAGSLSAPAREVVAGPSGSAAFSLPGDRLAWAPPRGLVRPLEAEGPITALRFIHGEPPRRPAPQQGAPPSRSGALLLGPGGALWNLDTGLRTWRPSGGLPPLAQVGPSGVVAVHDGELLAWDATGRPIAPPHSLPDTDQDMLGDVLGLPCDAVARRGGRRWGWTWEGMLLEETLAHPG